MSEEATFDPIDQESNERMFGPRAILLCGLSQREQTVVEGFARKFENLPITVAVEQDLSSTVGQLVKRADRIGFGQEADLPSLVLMSGLTEAQVHEFMALYKKADLSKPLWATLTPTSATWLLSDLLRELEAERRAMSSLR